MQLTKWEGTFYGIVGGVIFLVAFCLSFFIAFFVMLAAIIASLPCFMDARYQDTLALWRYDLECSILAALRSARMLTGQEWMTLEQIVMAVEHKLRKRCIRRDCIIVLNELIINEVVEVGELPDESLLVYRLANKAYVPQMPEKIEPVRKKTRQPLVT